MRRLNDIIIHLDYEDEYKDGKVEVNVIASEPEELVRCKDCKHFTLNLVENVDGVPLIVAHEVCSFWGDGCKTSQEGFCSFGERKNDEIN